MTRVMQTPRFALCLTLAVLGTTLGACGSDKTTTTTERTTTNVPQSVQPMGSTTTTTTTKQVTD